MSTMADFNEIVDPHITDQAGQLRSLFTRAMPFRHLCIDGFLTQFVPGTFTLAAGLPAETSDALSLEIESTPRVTPEGPNGPTLVFVLREIELLHSAGAA
jgi:hypothetical protein